MGLTSDNVLVLAVLSAVLLFAGTVWLWPRLARHGWRAVGGRIAVLLATQVALFASVGLVANQAFGFYASWADLLGRESGQGVVVDHDGADTGGPLRVVDTQPLNGAGGARPQVGGQIQKVEIVGRTTRIATPAYVYLPPEYFQARYRTRTFPAAVVLTGYPGTAEALVKGLHYPRTARGLAREGTAQPMILIMLRPTVAPPRDTECVDVPGGPRTESFFARDLPDAVGHHYRVGRRPGSWGIVGDSTGGYCALKLAMHHPRVYAAGAGLSPYYKAPSDPTTGDLFQGDKTSRNEADLFWYLAHRPAPDTSLLVTSSKQGETNYKDTLKFIETVEEKQPTRISSIILDSGGHNFNTWRREIPATLQWLSGRLSDR
ncbi:MULTISPECIES: alpha/beta hydrolase [Streptomyces]|uniref:Dienelactone hydrolase n=1 Tax=Streptomyces stelliscabiei TaxID=146820 RepID=A0A8I0P7U7_9ACTN|nr:MULTISPECIES: alpha/beta hydrolase-fold protein [Streptomyces]KND28825.1 esterase [Streptomyces stelliscabiei]MBE1599142.1 dienelactone hydrolase [Streptomyces stelliscabiei]MDX2520001.1 alpha/beta hydrolase-fold protein [Streptomyces stelliscabiei]MDX2552888.1 alpha/beta hydrolase-fold protein [Streptomyces stelliscabiei]MDX2613791.1 alpha/beta hydrolase-fold protein [Streptomyces stelliscabiei]